MKHEKLVCRVGELNLSTLSECQGVPRCKRFGWQYRRPEPYTYHMQWHLRYTAWQCTMLYSLSLPLLLSFIYLLPPFFLLLYSQYLVLFQIHYLLLIHISSLNAALLLFSYSTSTSHTCQLHLQIVSYFSQLFPPSLLHSHLSLQLPIPTPPTLCLFW